MISRWTVLTKWIETRVEEFESTVRRRGPTYDWTFDPDAAAPARGPAAKPRAAVLREEGTNGDREMAAALMAAGFDVWDVNTQDLLDGTTLEAFQVPTPSGFYQQCMFLAVILFLEMDRCG